MAAPEERWHICYRQRVQLAAFAALFGSAVYFGEYRNAVEQLEGFRFGFRSAASSRFQPKPQPRVSFAASGRACNQHLHG